MMRGKKRKDQITTGESSVAYNKLEGPGTAVTRLRILKGDSFSDAWEVLSYQPPTRACTGGLESQDTMVRPKLRRQRPSGTNEE